MSSYGMVGESRNAQRAGNAGTRPATHTGDSTPRPEHERRMVRGWRWLKRIVGVDGVLERRRLARRLHPERK